MKVHLNVTAVLFSSPKRHLNHSPCQSFVGLYATVLNAVGWEGGIRWGMRYRVRHVGINAPRLRMGADNIR